MTSNSSEEAGTFTVGQRVRIKDLRITGEVKFITRDKFGVPVYSLKSDNSKINKGLINVWANQIEPIINPIRIWMKINGL